MMKKVTKRFQSAGGGFAAETGEDGIGIIIIKELYISGLRNRPPFHHVWEQEGETRQGGRWVMLQFLDYKN